MHLVDLWFLALAERALDDAQCCFPSIVPKHFLEVAQLLQLFRHSLWEPFVVCSLLLETKIGGAITHLDGGWR